MVKTYSIAREFSMTPGGRFKKHGPYSGEAFRDGVLRDLLQRAINSGDRLVVELDGTAGYGSSFLEEAFGGLIRLSMFDREQVSRHLELRAKDPLYEIYRISANRYMENACLSL